MTNQHTDEMREAIMLALTYPSKADETLDEQADHILFCVNKVSTLYQVALREAREALVVLSKQIEQLTDQTSATNSDYGYGLKQADKVLATINALLSPEAV